MSDLTTQGATDAAEGLMTLYTPIVSRVGIGDSAALFAISQVDLQGANKYYKIVDSIIRASNRITATATFATSEGNGFAVREVCLDRTTRMLVRNVPAVSIPAKTSAEEWTFTINVDFTPG